MLFALTLASTISALQTLSINPQPRFYYNSSHELLAHEIRTGHVFYPRSPEEGGWGLGRSEELSGAELYAGDEDGGFGFLLSF